MIRVVLPAAFANTGACRDEVALDVAGQVTRAAVLDALEARYPMLQGTIRDHDTQRRRPFVRFFACEEDWSHESPDVPLPGCRDRRRAVSGDRCDGGRIEQREGHEDDEVFDRAYRSHAMAIADGVNLRGRRWSGALCLAQAIDDPPEIAVADRTTMIGEVDDGAIDVIELGDGESGSRALPQRRCTACRPECGRGRGVRPAGRRPAAA